MQIGLGPCGFMQDMGVHVHALLVTVSRGRTSIDTIYNDDASVVLKELKQIGRPAADTKNIVPTDAHRSHTEEDLWCTPLQARNGSGLKPHLPYPFEKSAYG
jgi:hypothetical protein